MFIVDAHQDIAYNYACFGRDYRVGALRKRQLETAEIMREAGVATLGLPEALVGRVAVVFATIFVAPYSRQPAPWSAVMYRDAAEAHTLGMQQLDYYHRLVDENERLMLIQSEADLDAVLATWAEGTPIQQRRQGLVLLIEGADPIREPQAFEEWYERGVRLVGISWGATRYAGGTGAPGPLTSDGHELLDVLMGFNAVLDLSHSAEQAFFQALDRYEGAVIASHSNPRAFRNTDRHLSDEMIRRLAERDGVMGIVLYNSFLSNDWTKSDGKRAVPLSRVVDAIDYVCQVTGSASHVGIGTDFDGGFGTESIPYELDTVADLWLLRDALRQRGFDDEATAAVLGGNMLRKLRPALAGR